MTSGRSPVAIWTACSAVTPVATTSISDALCRTWITPSLNKGWSSTTAMRVLLATGLSSLDHSQAPSEGGELSRINNRTSLSHSCEQRKRDAASNQRSVAWGNTQVGRVNSLRIPFQTSISPSTDGTALQQSHVLVIMTIRLL